MKNGLKFLKLFLFHFLILGLLAYAFGRKSMSTFLIIIAGALILSLVGFIKKNQNVK